VRLCLQKMLDEYYESIYLNGKKICIKNTKIGNLRRLVMILEGIIEQG
jgi:hypothetical protein